MTKFETIGVNRQYDAGSKEEAIRSMTLSCECCCKKGMRIDCDRCAIAYANSLVTAYFEDNRSSCRHCGKDAQSKGNDGFTNFL